MPPAGRNESNPSGTAALGDKADKKPVARGLSGAIVETYFFIRNEPRLFACT